jgi:hypothetical protein
MPLVENASSRHPREDQNHLYREFSPGDKLSFDLVTLSPDGEPIKSPVQATIADIRGGGFFGRVFIPEQGNFVIKTSLPDPWHHLWRMINWEFQDLPARTEEVSARLEYLSTKLIHEVLPVVSNGLFCSPDSFGYTKLSTGYAQVVEKMEGRGPRFDLPEKEFKHFRKAQKTLTEMAYSLGLEQAGQIHPNNPFGLANLWYDEKNFRWIWLDTIPAIRHTGYVKPFFRFRFHDEVRKEFSSAEPTFNKIHSDRFIATVAQFKDRFLPSRYKQIMADITLYDNLLRQKETAIPQDGKNFQSAGQALTASMKDALTERMIYKMLADPAYRKENLKALWRFARDPEYRILWVNNNIILAGIKQARKEEIVSEEELNEAIETTQSPEYDGKLYTGLYVYYRVSSQIINIIEGSTYLSAFMADNFWARMAMGLFIGRALPMIVRPTGTIVAGKITGKNLKAATIASIAPFVGPETGIIAQFGADGGMKSKPVMHYTTRNIIAGLSSIFPQGGWNTQLEGELMEILDKTAGKLGKRI